VIEVTNLVRRYGPHIAVDHASFKIEKGEIVGFLGPNGAGKSTTMNILTGYLSSTEGTVLVDGMDILEHPTEIKKKIGYLPETPPLYMDMTVSEYLSFTGEIKKIPPKEKKDRMNRIMETVGVKDVSGRLIKNLSKGYKQRVGLAQAMIGDPEVLILDEPTAGLDPKQILEIRDLIIDLGKDHTIILSSHILPEVSAVCKRVLIINQGVIVADGAPENLAKRILGGSHILLRLDGARETVSKALEGIPAVQKVEFKESQEPGTVEAVAEASTDASIGKETDGGKKIRFEFPFKYSYHFLFPPSSFVVKLRNISSRLISRERIIRIGIFAALKERKISRLMSISSPVEVLTEASATASTVPGSWDSLNSTFCTAGMLSRALDTAFWAPSSRSSIWLPPRMRFARFSGVSSATMAPRLMMSTRLQTALTSGRIWELRIMV
jgi:ABC-2 type transport system ATP-binding protein